MSSHRPFSQRRALLLLVALLLGLAGPLPTQGEEAPSPALAASYQSLTALQKSRLLKVINKASLPDLMKLPGIGEVRANAILRGRPFSSPLDLLRVKGIGEATLQGLLDYTKGSSARSRRDG